MLVTIIQSQPQEPVSCQVINIDFETQPHRSNHTYCLLEIKTRWPSFTLTVSLARYNVIDDSNA